MRRAGSYCYLLRNDIRETAEGLNRQKSGWVHVYKRSRANPLISHLSDVKVGSRSLHPPVLTAICYSLQGKRGFSPPAFLSESGVTAECTPTTREQKPQEYIYIYIYIYMYDCFLRATANRKSQLSEQEITAKKQKNKQTPLGANAIATSAKVHGK